MVQLFTDLNYFVDELANLVYKIFTIVEEIMKRVDKLEAGEDVAA